MSETRTIRVMLVEDHIAFRQSLAFLLMREPDLEVVAQACSLAQARQMLDTPLDVAVVDLGLPDGDGRDLIDELRRTNAGISVVVLSATISRLQRRWPIRHHGGMNAYSEDLREKIVQALKRGMGKSQAARTFSVSLSSV